jgi:hypothetical protein
VPEKANVVDLSDCRNLLARWDQVRQLILQGEAEGWALCLRRRSGKETMFLAGNFETNSDDALVASMNISWEMTKRSGLPSP